MVTMRYTRKVPRATGTGEAAINRGMCCFLACVTSAGDQWLYDGADIEAHLKRIQARRREIQRDIVASARVGHGRARALAPIAKLEAAGERWRKTKNQTVARRLADWLLARGAGKHPLARIGKLYLEDFSGIRDSDWDTLDGGKVIWDRIQEWPYYALGQALKNCLQAEGIEVIERPAHYISRRCPKSGVIDYERQGAAPRVLKCSHCGFRRHIDIVACMNELAAARGEWSQEEVLANGAANKRKTKGNK